MYVVFKERLDGSFIAGTPPVVHETYAAAEAEAKRLAANVADAKSFLVFKATSRSSRCEVPVETVGLI